MNIKDEVNKSAPERLWLASAGPDGDHEVWFDPDEGGTPYVRADLALTAALASPEQGEPTVWVMTTPEAGNRIVIWDEAEAKRFREMDGRTIVPMYAHPPKEEQGEPMAWIVQDGLYRDRIFLDRQLAQNEAEKREMSSVIIPLFPHPSKGGERPPEGYALVPIQPSDDLLRSMAIRYDHGLGLPEYYDRPVFGAENVGHAKRLASTMTTMRQLHEEVVGTGFYRARSALAGKEGA